MAKSYVIANGTTQDANETAALINRCLGHCVNSQLCSTLSNSHLAQVFVIKRTPSLKDRLLGNPEQIIAALCMQLLPGHALAKVDPPAFRNHWYSRVALISFLAVEPHERQRGWSRPLIERAVKWALTQHATHIAAVSWAPTRGVQSRDMLLRADFRELAQVPMRKVQPDRLCHRCAGTCDCRAAVLIRPLSGPAWESYQRQHQAGGSSQRRGSARSKKAP